MQFVKSKIFLFTISFLVLSSLVVFYLNKSFNVKEQISPKLGNVVESIYGLGTVTADNIFRVRTGISLSVHKLYVSEGDSVNKGDPLVQLEGNIMRSPIAGTVTAVSYKNGELVTPQVAIVTVTNLAKLFLEVSLEQQSVLRVKKGQQVSVSFESLRSEKCEGTVSSIYPRDNQFIVRIELKSWPSGVLPGMTADVAIIVGKKTNVLLIPIRSIVAGQMTRVRNRKKEVIPVKLGVTDGEWVEIVSDNLREDDFIIIRSN